MQAISLVIARFRQPMRNFADEIFAVLLICKGHFGHVFITTRLLQGSLLLRMVDVRNVCQTAYCQ